MPEPKIPDLRGVPLGQVTALLPPGFPSRPPVPVAAFNSSI
jgi:hypothetical protein